MKRYLSLLLALLLGLTIWSFINPHDMQVWWTEMTAVILLVSALVGTFRIIRLSNTAYACLFIWCAMQIIGAHYTFEFVPFDAVSRLFGEGRNHYDRVAHFAVGLGSIAIAEVLSRLPDLRRKIILLRYFRDMSQTETAKLLGLTQVKVSREEKKIMEFLRKELS